MVTENVVSNILVTHAYRHLYRQGLRAVQYSKPARYVLRDRIRDAFRKRHPADYDEQKLATTIEFLRGATNSKGIEHRLVKNLLLALWWETSLARSPHSSLVAKKKLMNLPHSNHWQFHRTIRMLNESMGMCL